MKRRRVILCSCRTPPPSTPGTCCRPPVLPQVVRPPARDDPRRPDGDTTRADVAGSLHHHHTGEDELLWPALRERVAVRADLVARTEEQHERMGELLHTAGELLPGWQGSTAAGDRDKPADVVEQASRVLDEHLGEEERWILPLVSHHITHDEWATLGERIYPARFWLGFQPVGWSVVLSGVPRVIMDAALG